MVEFSRFRIQNRRFRVYGSEWRVVQGVERMVLCLALRI